MNRTIQYLREYIDSDASYEVWDGKEKNSLSLYLIGNFQFYLVTLLGEEILFLFPTDSCTPAQLERRLEIVEEQTSMQGVLVVENASPYLTRKFIADRVGFVVPGKQISLPFLATHIKSMSTHRAKEIMHFSPMTQLVFLYILYAEEEEFELGVISRELGVSDMTGSRAMRDLVDAGLLKWDVAGKTGRKKIFSRIPLKDYYADGRKHLSSPVRDVVYVKQLPEGLEVLKSDLTALSDQTMLNDAGPDRYCLVSRERTRIAEYEISKEQALEENLPMIQLTKYDIRYLSRTGYEDPVSMILGLTENDERIEMAIDELMEEYEWYEA